jgi:hypothetical protein
MSDCGSEAGCDWLLLDEEEFRLGVLVDRCIGIDGIEGFEEEGLGRFDHDEGWDETTEGIFNLRKSVDVISKHKVL